MFMKISPLFLSLLLFATAPLQAQAIVGSWFIKGAGESKSYAVLTFLANGTYLMAEDGDSTLDPSGKDGMERGTYKWNPTTKAFSCETLVDTTGEWGLSDGSIKKISVSGNTLTVAGLKLKRVTSTSSKLVGSWYLEEDGGYALCTFLSNGTYFQVQDGPRKEDAQTGIERGTYTWNTSTKVLTRKVLLDTNGSWGHSDKGKRKVLISGNKLTLKVANEGKYKLSKVVAP